MNINTLLPTLEQHLTTHQGQETIIHSHQAVSGGDINQAYQLQTNRGLFFVKMNSASRFPGMFATEISGLKRLHEAAVIGIPGPISTGEEGDDAFLLMAWMEPGREIENYWEDFGKSVAKLHAVTNSSFGLDHANYIGSLPQSNNRHDDWVSFFVEERLEAQVKMAVDAGVMPTAGIRRFDGLYAQLPNIFPVEAPALLHGDLWSGNFSTGPDGKAWIYDPAVYFGHREMDLAMTKLFGGYNKIFYDAYTTIRPLAPGWLKRVEICNLYPLLVHANLFGGGYLQSVQAVVNKF